jgi:hypothetical protein
MFLLVGYGACGLVSFNDGPNGLQSGLHGSSQNYGLQMNRNQSSLTTACWFQSVFNAANNFSIEEKSRLKFTDFPKAKKFLAKAGRSKPQGDLIIYFGEQSCLGEGVNGAGKETMKLQNASSLKD